MCNAAGAVRERTRGSSWVREEEQVCGLLLSGFPSYGMRTMFVKAHGTLSLGLSHRDTVCLFTLVCLMLLLSS